MSFTRTLLLSPAILAAVASVATAASTVDGTYTDVTLGSMVYRIYVPDNYQATGPDKTPVVLYLHSAAERGNSIDDIFINPYGQSGHWVNPWINYLVDETQTGAHQAVLIIPQSGLGKVWSSTTAGDNWDSGNYTDATSKPITKQLQMAMNILTGVTSSYNVDTNKIYVTGASMGGYGTWEALARYSDVFAAGMPVSGAGNISAAATELNSVPIWTYHGGADGIIPASNTDALYFTMKQNGSSTLYSRLPSEGHAGFDLFYDPGYFTTDKPGTTGGSGGTVYDWLFSQDLSQRQTVTNPQPSNHLVVDMNGAIISNFATDYLASEPDLIAYNRMKQTGSTSNLTYTDGRASTIDITWVSGTAAAINTNASLSDELGKIFPEMAGRGFIGTNGANSSLVWRIDGLDDSLTYDFDILSSRDGTGTARSAFVIKGLNTVSGEINSKGNSELLALHGVHSLNGSVLLTLKAGTGNTGFTYFNGMQITVVPEPATAGILTAGALLLGRRRKQQA